MQGQIVCKTQTVNLVGFSNDTLDSAVTVYQIHIDYEEECWQQTSLSESNTHREQSFCI